MDVSLDRLGKPYVTNGVTAELVETFMPVPPFNPTVNEAFGADKSTPMSTSGLKRKFQGGPVPSLRK